MVGVIGVDLYDYTVIPTGLGVSSGAVGVGCVCSHAVKHLTLFKKQSIIRTI